MTFYFYDLETSGGSPRSARIMQFAGQRTNENLEPIGEPDNILLKLADDVLPEPDAVLVHGITPQKAQQEGITEAEFATFFHEKVATPGTIFVGFNNIRFDDEFMRKVCYRTFFDPYQWHWKDKRARWDLLDPLRMMRALRPDGLKWPFINGKPTVKLELLAKENGVMHDNAHDALADVEALLELAQKFKKAQQKLFEFLLATKDKRSVAAIVENAQPFVYTSGRYSSEFEKTTVVSTVFKHPRRDAAIVFNLREDPDEWSDKTPEELVKHWNPPYDDTETKRLPVKTLLYNRCPAIAPIGVIDKASAERISLDMKIIEENRKKLMENTQLREKLEKALDILENEQQTRFKLEDVSVDDQLYDGFWSENDLNDLLEIRMSDPDGLSTLQTKVKNRRIRDMIPLFKARNYPKLLSDEEREQWEAHRQNVFYGGGKKSQFAKFSKRMQEIGSRTNLSDNDQYLLTELQLYAESILPEPGSAD